jgi:hypothetical protein
LDANSREIRRAQQTPGELPIFVKSDFAKSDDSVDDEQGTL